VASTVSLGQSLSQAQIKVLRKLHSLLVKHQPGISVSMQPPNYHKTPLQTLFQLSSPAQLPNTSNFVTIKAPLCLIVTLKNNQIKANNMSATGRNNLVSLVLQLSLSALASRAPRGTINHKHTSIEGNFASLDLAHYRGRPSEENR
jgi:hypothetical protein